MEKPVYFDHAATSFPKHPLVIEAMRECMATYCGNPGRSGHGISLEAARMVFRTREALAGLFNIRDSSRIVFTSNATEALNIALFGMLGAGSHVITTSMEHNAVMRPIRHLEATRGIQMTVLPCREDGALDPSLVAGALRDDTALLVINHASNVTGTIQPLREISAMKGNVPLLVDGAQSAGALPVDVERDCIDFLAFTGHKSLLGPTGTGGLYIGPGFTLPLFRIGGTGSLSEQEEMPDFLPDRFESGTLNVAGLAGLLAGVEIILRDGIPAIRERERRLTEVLLDGLSGQEGIKVHGPGDAALQTSTVSITMNGLLPSECAALLDRRYSVMARSGLQCAPAAHRTIGTFPVGTLRLSMGYSTTEDEVAFVLKALKEIGAGHE